MNISLITAHGRKILNSNPEDRVFDVLKKNQIPWSSTSIYKKNKSTDIVELYPDLSNKITDLSSDDELLVFINRNINPFINTIDQLKIIETEDSNIGSEYIYQDYDNSSGLINNYLKKLSPNECKKIIKQNIDNFIIENLKDNDKIIVGVSGGGDSNALLYGMTQFSKFSIEIHPVILKGIADWDKGLPKAQLLCKKYNLNLTIIEEDEVKELIGMKKDRDFIAQFEKHFEGDDFEFFGTLLIRLGLMKIAKQFDTQYICTGLNLEDLYSEFLALVSTNRRLAEIPVREIGNNKLLFPLWLTPKKIIDGCFPKYSLDNYMARYPCFSLGRTTYYQMAYQFQSLFPGMIEDMMKGISLLSKDSKLEAIMDEELNFHTSEKIPFPLKQKFIKMLRD